MTNLRNGVGLPVLMNVLCILVVQVFSRPAGSAYVNDDFVSVLSDSSLEALILPVPPFAVEYVNFTQSAADTQFSDSFYLDAVKSIIQVITARNFKLCPASRCSSAVPESLIITDSIHFSRIDTSRGDSVSTARWIAKTAGIGGADLVVVPYRCIIKHVTKKPSGWRSGGPTYERPLSFTAYCDFHVQIWNKNGILLYEKRIPAVTGRPILYEVFGKKNVDKDMESFARRLFAPPLIKVIYKAVQEAFDPLKTP